ncbi:hypothetical protein [Saccharothrix sp. ST-888]|uniref:hypothetical protein n=1 Tax=Saccharothrix sp. ST-888 TaxID=1427391 RepID=UPI0005EC6FA9|nr:hypothetical protein [Saccharothrix sp. ST-888]KJK55405.1 hypothetical protein UK12_28850 [Saccharothrix sp. ST-888]
MSATLATTRRTVLNGIAPAVAALALAAGLLAAQTGDGAAHGTPSAGDIVWPAGPNPAVANPAGAARAVAAASPGDIVWPAPAPAAAVRS